MTVDPALAATIWTVVGGAVTGLLLPVITAIAGRIKVKPADEPVSDHRAVVERVASGKASYGPEALQALAQAVSEAGARIDVLEAHERRYLRRIDVLEHWGMYSPDPIPRRPPQWDDDPRIT